MRSASYLEHVIETHGLTRLFGSGDNPVFAVRDLTFNIQSGEFVVLLGRSGSGKTTLLNLLGGLDAPTEGRVVFAGRDLSSLSESEITEMRRREVGYVFQAYGLLPLLSAYENVELPLRINGVPRRERRHRVEELLALVGLLARSSHRPYELSGGEQQRVAIARSLAVRPSLLLADEPTGDLDSATGISIATLMRDVTKEEGITFVAATHDLRLAGLADRVLQMVDGAFSEDSAPLERH